MLLVPGFGGGESEEDLPVLTGAALGEIPVDALFEALVGEVALPPPDGPAVGRRVGGRGGRRLLVRHWCDAIGDHPLSSTLAQLLKYGLLSIRDLRMLLMR